jgi:hypothetical protein
MYWYSARDFLLIESVLPGFFNHLGLLDANRQ